LRTLSQKASARESESVRRYVGWMKQIPPDTLPDLLADPKLAGGAYPLIAGIIGPLLDSPRTRHFADRVAFTSLNLWLAEDSNMRVDKMSMAMSIESRAPFEDHELAALALSIPLSYKLRNGDFKSILKTAVADLVPQEILSRPKWGFFPPASDWLRTVLRPLVETYLAPDRIAAAGIFRPEAVSRLVESHIVKREYQLWPLWTLFVFQIWHALYIEGSLTLPYKIAPTDLLPNAVPDAVRNAVPV
jgi:asparagine synthase (glutamine-hydrolysing)